MWLVGIMAAGGESPRRTSDTTKDVLGPAPGHIKPIPGTFFDLRKAEHLSVCLCLPLSLPLSVTTLGKLSLPSPPLTLLPHELRPNAAYRLRGSFRTSQTSRGPLQALLLCLAFLGP